MHVFRLRLAAALVGLLALTTGAAAAAGASTFHTTDNCVPLETTTICFEAWGLDKLTTSASGNQLISSHAHRRFTEFTGGVLTFEQRDMSHFVMHVDRSGAVRGLRRSFSGWSTRVGAFVCTWREHLAVQGDRILHSVDDFSCTSV